MMTVRKQLLAGTPDDVRAMVEYLACGQDHLEYLAGTWLRELAVKLAACDGVTVSVVSYDDTAGYELEVTLVSAPHHDPVVIGRSQPGDHCQITLERWLPISGEPGIADAVNIIHAILAASARPDPVRIIRYDGGTVNRSGAVRPHHASHDARVTCTSSQSAPAPDETGPDRPGGCLRQNLSRSCRASFSPPGKTNGESSLQVGHGCHDSTYRRLFVGIG